MPKGIGALRQRVLSSGPQLKEERLYVPEWDCEVIVRELTGKERANFLTTITDPKTGARRMDRFYADIVIMSVIDPDTGLRAFEPGDRDPLNNGSGNVLERIAQVATRISALSGDAFETAEKNSESDPNSSTPTN